VNDIDGSPSQGFTYDEEKWPNSTTEIVQQQTRRRERETLRGQERQARRDRLCWFLFCVLIGATGLCVVITQIYQEVSKR
jgi:cell division septal protein FtsQ